MSKVAARLDLSTALRLLLAPPAVLLLLLAFAGRAEAGAWGTPVDLSGTGEFAERLSVGSDGAGGQVAVWEHEMGIADDVWLVQAAVRPAGGSWSAPVDLSAAGAEHRAPSVSVNQYGEAIVAWQEPNGSKEAIEVVRGDVAGDWGTPEVISGTGIEAIAAEAGIDANGNAIVAWQQQAGSGYFVPTVAVEEGGSWGTPQVLNPDDATSYESQLAVDPAGDAVLLWYGGNTIDVARRPAGGSWSAPTVLLATNFMYPRLTINEAGEAAATWENWGGGPRHLEMARMSAAGTWAPAEALPTGSGSYQPMVALTDEGEVITTWIEEIGSNYAFGSSTQAAGGSWTTPTTMPLPDSYVFQAPVAVDPSGAATSFIYGWDGTDWAIDAVRRPAGGAWGSLLELSEAGEELTDPTITIAVTGEITIGWIYLPGTESIARVVHLSGTLTARSTERPVKTTTPAGSKTEASTSGTAPIVCGASPSVAAAKPYTPAEIISGKTVLGVRARISVPTPSQVGVVATITYSRDGKRRSVAAGTYSMRVGSERNLKVPLPSALRAELPLGSKVGVTLRTSTKPTGGSACAAPTEKTSKLKLKVVRVLGAS